MQEIDRIQAANEAIDRRARQREAAAAALAEANTPEAIAAEKARQMAATALERGEAPAILVDDAVNGDLAEAVAAFAGGPDYETSDGLSAKLAEALQPVLEGATEDQSSIIGIGRSVFQWILVPSEDPDNAAGYELSFLLQVDEQPPGGFSAEITPELLSSWAAGKGLQGNRIEHKQFVQTLFERALAVGMNETGNQLVYVLEQLMVDSFGDGRNWGRPHEDEPTETAVGDDEELPDEHYEALADAAFAEIEDSE